MSAVTVVGGSVAVWRLEQRLFWRNRALVVPTFLVPVAMCVSIPFTVPAGLDWDGVPYRGHFLTAMIAMITVYSTFTTLVVTLTSRRDASILKRLRGTELSDRSILAGNVLTAYVLSGLQLGLLLAIGLVALGVPAPANPLLLVIALGYGTAVFAVLAAAYTALIPNAESAQILCIPVLFACFACSGIFVPLSVFPDWLRAVAELLPVTALVDAVRAAFYGGGALPRDAAVLGVWWAVGLIATRRFFRWEVKR